MELKKVWMSPDTKKKSKYGYRAVGGILGIVLLMVPAALWRDRSVIIPGNK